MKFFQGKPRNQWEMDCLDAHFDADNEVRLIDLFVDSLNLSDHTTIANFRIFSGMIKFK